jgi:hypothetical protein
MNTEELAAFLQKIEQDLTLAADTRNIPTSVRDELHMAADSVVTAQRILLNPEDHKQ